MSDLSELIERLEKATGPDRELDIAIAFYTRFRPSGGLARQSFDEHEAKHGYATAWIAHAPWRGEWGIPAFTASLDAVVALVEKMLPGWEYVVGSTHADFLSENDPRFGADLAGPVSWAKDPEYGCMEPSCATSCARGSTPAIALLIALLRALSDREKG